MFTFFCACFEECDLYYTGKAQRTSNYAVSQLLIESNPVRPGDTMTLQCSVFSDSDKKTYPGDLNILWVREGSDKSLPNIIYTDRNRSNECEKRSDHQKTCVYHFSKNVSSSDAGTYYCAVATCGEILFGSGTTVVIQGNTASRVVFLLCAVVVISLIVIAVLIYTIKINNSDHPKGKIINTKWAWSDNIMNEMCTTWKQPAPSPFDRLCVRLQHSSRHTEGPSRSLFA
uniref:Ig-like domain-containing protein n=1 Tax=Pundamilia nyererei TaxID=303518 RepID=A0A3B4G1T6_9CICH